jgi:hypothetical protein
VKRDDENLGGSCVDDRQLEVPAPIITDHAVDIGDVLRELDGFDEARFAQNGDSFLYSIARFIGRAEVSDCAFVGTEKIRRSLPSV